jgi:hypothetical protein
MSGQPLILLEGWIVLSRGAGQPLTLLEGWIMSGQPLVFAIRQFIINFVVFCSNCLKAFAVARWAIFAVDGAKPTGL